MFEIKFKIPELHSSKISQLYAKIKPVVHKDNKLYYLREFSDEELSNVAYLWNIDENISQEVPENILVPLERYDFYCLHKFASPALFKPTIAEVLAQISQEVISIACAFEIIKCPERKEDFFEDSFKTIAFENSFHVSTVRLYANKCNEILK